MVVSMDVQKVEQLVEEWDEQSASQLDISTAGSMVKW
jgi:hypothetical protein